jgi:predicted amidohydrolase
MDAVFEQIATHHKTVDLVCFPENCLFMRGGETDIVPILSLEEGIWLAVANWAEKLSATLHLGSVPWREDGKFFNASLMMSAGDSRPRVVYRKIHLFDSDVGGDQNYRESATFSPGTEPAIVDGSGWLWGQSICYDLRFPELYTYYRNQGVHGLFIPAAFTVPTGLAHWHTLVRARAIETQTFVLAAAQCGEHGHSAGPSRRTFGHSLIVDPWGEILWDGGESPGWKVLELDFGKLEKVRKSMPIQQHRRL